MRVVIGPRTDPRTEPTAERLARALAEPQGEIVSLREMGVHTMARALSAAEVALLRASLAGPSPADHRTRPDAARKAESAVQVRGHHGVVGYVCSGVGLGGDIGGATGNAVAVTDHVNLTWRSPLTGPNDDAIGARFPSMTGLYATQTVVDRAAGEGMIVVPGVVAGVNDDGRLSALETELMALEAYGAASSELVPVAIVAAHMGLRLAAVVVLAGSSRKGDG